MKSKITNLKPAKLVPALLDWFAQNARDLPWRRTRDAYAIWVSEIMLQQTQVKTVIPFWERWMRELPSVEALAAAPPAKIHKLWEGLGYYTRVRNMQKAAQQMVERAHAAKSEKGKLVYLSALTPALSPRRGGNAHSISAGAGVFACSSACAGDEIGDSQSSSLRSRGRGAARRGGAAGRSRGDEAQTEKKSETPHVVSYKFPDTFEGVLALPGVGRYTAGAICSIAFNLPTPILDGNVMRVLTRVFGIAENPKEKNTNAKLWKLAEELVKTAERGRNKGGVRKAEGGTDAAARRPHHNSCSHLNQSLMELGALVCSPRSPQCGICPVRKWCVAFREDRVEELPNLAKRAAATARRFVALVVERDGKFLVRQRPAGVVNAQLWEFPNVELPENFVWPSPQQMVFPPPPSPGLPPSQPMLRRTGRPPAPAGEGVGGEDRPPGVSWRILEAKPLCTVKHSITRYRITLEAYRAEMISGTRVTRPSPARSSGVWLTPAEMGKLAFTGAHRKILGRLG